VYRKKNVKLPALKGGASRKGKYLFQIASLNPALKGRVKGSKPVKTFPERVF
jgi:hypothetical protein